MEISIVQNLWLSDECAHFASGGCTNCPKQRQGKNTVDACKCLCHRKENRNVKKSNHLPAFLGRIRAFFRRFHRLEKANI